MSNIPDNKLEEIIKLVGEIFPESSTAIIFFHFDKENKNLKTMSPFMPVTSLDELYSKLWHCREAVSQFLEDMVKRGLEKRGQAN